MGVPAAGGAAEDLAGRELAVGEDESDAVAAGVSSKRASEEPPAPSPQVMPRRRGGSQTVTVSVEETPFS